MATLKGQTIAASYQDLVKRADTYSQTGTNIEIMNDSAVVQPTGLYLESGATTDNVGIGVADPDATLEILDTTTQLKLSYDATNYATFNIAADGLLTITTVDPDGAEADIILAPDGNVGIGTASPENLLTVVDRDTPARLGLYYDDAYGDLSVNDDMASIDFGMYDRGEARYGVGARILADAVGWGGAVNDYPTALIFQTCPDASGTLADRMYISKDGSVGIGNSTLETGHANHTQMQVGALGVINAETSENTGQILGLFQNYFINASGAKEYIYDDEASGIEIGNAGTIKLLVSNAVGSDGGTFTPLTAVIVENNGRVGINGTPYGTLQVVANTDGNARGVVMNSSYNATSNYIYNSNAELSTGTTLMYTAKTGGTGFAFMAMNSDGAATDQFKFRGDGTGQSNVAWTDNSLDYAEYFESKDGAAIPIGSTVVLDGDKIKQAEVGEVPIGVVRPVGASSAHGDMWNHWYRRYLTDDYGGNIMEEYTITEWEDKTLIHEAVEAKEAVLDEDGNEIEEAVDAQDAVYETEDVWFESDKIPEDKIVPDDASVRGINDQGKQFMRRKENPDYDTDREYSSREFRDEWHIVGLLGQIPITKGQPLADNWVKMKDVSDTVEMYFVK